VSRYEVAVEDAAGGCVLRVRVTPRARANELNGVHGTAARVRVAAPPADGRANAAVLAFLADVLGVPRRDLRIVRGTKGRDKKVQIHGLDATAVAARLDAAHA
jgi:uncharacterized protein